MRKEFNTLYLKESAIIATIDELSSICTASNADVAILQSVLTALSAYPNGCKGKSISYYTVIADHCINVADNLLRLCLWEQAPAFALHTIDEVLSIALGHIQTTIIQHTVNS
jgi:hypothetical protein